jgi:hypothetical protein
MRTQLVNTKHVGVITVIDPDTRLPVAIEIRKLATGEMIGLDEAYLVSLGGTSGNPNNPYAAGKINVPDDEDGTIRRMLIQI